ncbi:MAG: nucleoside-diphosphate kinase [Candidatus Diapherotrites archaeon]|nr:nucleoside-diphosphate kinase [Candidatus Diapherotrites archaeon]
MVNEKTLVIIKPDAVNRGLVGEIITRFENKGLKIVAMKMELLKEEILEHHYAHHKGKSFFQGLIRFMSSVPSVIMVLEGKEAVRVVRKMCGDTCGRDAEAGTIRGDFSMSVQNNIIHASESIDAAKEEIKRFFKDEEIHSYKRIDFEYLYAENERE